MLSARLSPKRWVGSSYRYRSCARNIITSSTDHVDVRLVASSHIFSCRPTARLWQSSILKYPATSEYIKIFSIGYSNFDSRGSVRFYRKHNRIEFKYCETVDEALQLALKQGDNLYPDHIAAMWSSVFRLISKGPQQKAISKEDMAQLELNIWDILEVTMDSLGRMRPRDLATITLQLAKIANRVSSKHYKRLNASEFAFRNILLDGESNLQYSIFDPLAEAANHILVDTEPRHLSNLAYAYSLLGYNPNFDRKTTLLANIADASLECIHHFNAQDISNMMLGYVKLNVSHDPLFQSVGGAVVIENDLTSFKPQALSNIVWAYATANIQHCGLFKKIGDEIVATDNLASFNPQDLSNTVWAYATANIQHAGLFEKLGDEIAKKYDLKSFNPQNFSNTVWAYATANIQHCRLFKKIGDEIVAMNDLKAFKPQALSNIVWAYATANIQHCGLFKKIGDEIVATDNLASFNPQDLSNTVWAYATANIQHAGLFEKLGDEIAKKYDLKSFNPQDFSNTVWAYATANIQHCRLFKKIGDEIVAMNDLKAFKPQELSNTVWAYAAANIQHPGLFKKIGDEILAMTDLKSFNSQELSNTVWAYATANIQHPGLFKKIGDVIVAMNDMKSFNSQDFSNTVSAYATANIQHPGLFKKISDEIATSKDKKSYTSQDLSNIAWAYAVSDLESTSLFNITFKKELLDRQNDFIDENLTQLYQWHLWQTKEKSNDGLPESLRDRCKHSFLSADTNVSAFQKDVVSELTPIGLTSVEEYRTESGYSIDALVEINGKKVGVEVDGPFHFIGRQPNGATVLKRRQIESIDEITLVSVPYWEWNELRKDRDKKQKYLQSLLKLKA